MAKKKKQHYGPQMILRNFSSDLEKKLIAIFNVENGFYKTDCAIKNQAQDDYFYGNDAVIEEYLAKNENETAPIIKAIINTENLPKRDSTEYVNLFTFVFQLAYRTQSSVELINEIVNKNLQEIIKHDVRLKKLEVRAFNSD
ncbi:DUF4238 domain-containing protein [Marivirga sp. S37H4]|uniref:DUF4238 domain-containing protein n=1 Tax=Marivirga aurantiaca TaxID=2802615 RepID=A0A934WYH8_9BACT|nr:DUF4238 domain-containing protein [Marivirga aurantiaca]MBK6265339.1 DUF4238 domain-containing protein [Marivirga aurantiaca]